MSDVVACSQERYYLTKQLWGGSRVLAYHVAQSLRPRVPSLRPPSETKNATTQYPHWRDYPLVTINRKNVQSPSQEQ